MQVELTPERLAARANLARSGAKILYEDNHLIGLAKRAGLLSQAGPPGVLALPEYLDTYRREAEGKPGRAYVGLVHRLDRNVSGVMVVAKTSKAAGRLAELLRDRAASLEKSYLAWVERVPTENSETLVHSLRRAGGITRLAGAGDDDAREARLAFEVEGRGRKCARLLVRLETGLPHQIRAQLSIVGHPLWGDAKYGGTPWRRPALHALRLQFPHPVGGEPLVLEAPVPADLRELDERRGLKPPVRTGGE
ncbi:MAG: RNA pseudouridine synthase [Planctomycetota bacterium]|nr:RNA pseudouridine synthase [Planctomycetota bacterium]